MTRRVFLSRALRAVAPLYCTAIVSACQADPGHAGRASRDWIEQLRKGDAQEREDAALALAQPGVVAIDALPGLAQMLNDSAHAAVRIQGVRAMGRLLMSSDAAERLTLLASLVPAHRDGNAAVRAAVADALGRITSSVAIDTTVQRALTTLVGDSVAATRLRAVEALGAIPGSAWRGALRLTLRDSSAAVRRAAVMQLRRDTLALAETQAQVVKLLTDSSAHVRLAAAHALTRFHAQGGRDASHEPTLLERCQPLPPRTRGC